MGLIVVSTDEFSSTVVQDRDFLRLKCSSSRTLLQCRKSVTVLYISLTGLYTHWQGMNKLMHWLKKAPKLHKRILEKHPATLLNYI